uniref:Uncharacterized protein n=1 Tax=Cyanistes caeruleus TaxID=156563 RepID=A0A8C0VAU9_CYACU
ESFGAGFASPDRDSLTDPQKLCYVASDPCQNMQGKPEKLSCEDILPDGWAVKAGEQLFQAPETPPEAEIPEPGIGRMHVQPNILRSVLLLGRFTPFQVFREASEGAPVRSSQHSSCGGCFTLRLDVLHVGWCFHAWQLKSI